MQRFGCVFRHLNSIGGKTLIWRCHEFLLNSFASAERQFERLQLRAHLAPPFPADELSSTYPVANKNAQNLLGNGDEIARTNSQRAKSSLALARCIYLCAPTYTSRRRSCARSLAARARAPLCELESKTGSASKQASVRTWERERAWLGYWSCCSMHAASRPLRLPPCQLPSPQPQPLNTPCMCTLGARALARTRRESARGVCKQEEVRGCVSS